MAKELYDFAGHIKHETPSGLLIDDGLDKYWLPKSLTQDNGDGTFTIPEWLAIEKEMI